MSNKFDIKEFLSEPMLNFHSSIIRDILKLTEIPAVISFAGGLPAPKSFPVDQLEKAVKLIFETKRDAWEALQYGVTQGKQNFINELEKLYKDINLKLGDDDQIGITSSSQQGLDLIGRAFINKGDKILASDPTYLGAIQAFNFYGAEFIPVHLDNEGMDPTDLKKKLQKYPDAKIIYTVPDFQNPTGVTLPLRRRREIVRLAREHNKLIIEDSPYKQIRFEGKHIPFIYTLASERTILLGTLSKILAPGFRIGWYIANKEISDNLVRAKQSTDLCTGSFVQAIAANYFAGKTFKEDLENTIKLYNSKKELMIKSFKKELPFEAKWTNPKGGLFLYVTIPEEWNVDTNEMLNKYAKGRYKVTFIPGSAFSLTGKGQNQARFNFSYANKSKFKEGAERYRRMIIAYRRAAINGKK